MNDTCTTTANFDQTDEDILTCEVSDEALEAAAGTEKGGAHYPTIVYVPYCR